MTLSRSFLNGALAIAGITAAFGFATEAQAVTFTVSQLNTSGFSHTEGDKEFSDFSIPTKPTTAGSFDPNDTVTISDNGGSFTIQFNANGASGAGTTPTLTTSGTLTYKVGIIPPFINVFAEAQNQTAVQGSGKNIVRGLTIAGMTPGTVTNTNGVPNPPGFFASGPKSITVTDSWTITGSGNRAIINFIDTFIQDPELPTIPEPSAVLGLLALGLCGTLVGRQKKG